MAKNRRRGNKKGDKLTIRPLPYSTIRKLIISGIGEDIQLCQEAVQVATAFWENEIQTWVSEHLLRQLLETNKNPNKTKPSSYRYKRITGLMALWSIEEYKKRGGK